MGSRIEIFAKKLREAYLREGHMPEPKTYIEPLRVRQPEDNIERCLANKEVAGNYIVYLFYYSCYRRKRRVSRC